MCATPTRSGRRRVLIALGVMAALTPLGLLAPGRAFGEAGPRDLDLKKYHLGALPDGLRHYAGFWHHALFNGYDFSHDKHPAIGYLLSAGFGILVLGVVVLAAYAIARLLRRSRMWRGQPGDGVVAS